MLNGAENTKFSQFSSLLAVGHFGVDPLLKKYKQPAHSHLIVMRQRSLWG